MRAAVAFGLGFIIPGWAPRRAEAAFRMGEVPSNVTLNDLRGNSITVPADFAGKAVLIHFWASWCAACRGEMENLESIYGKYGGKGVIPCSIGIGEKEETALRFLKNLTITYPVLLDPDASTRKPYGIAGVPTLFVLDRKGVIRHKIVGKADPEGLQRIVRSLL